MRIYKELFNKIIDPENLFSAWDKFRQDKRSKKDVQRFEKNLEQNIFQLHRDLRDRIYKHGPYESFFIADPKRRHIHKATVRDRILHHAIFKVLNPIFEPTFISNSFSCRIGKGTHKGVNALRFMLRKESQNNTRACYVLKCDVRKFFDSVDHDILLSILERRISDSETMWLLRNIIESYISEGHNLFHNGRAGIPIGNLTSQLFANMFMNELDQFVKHTLKVKHYARYTDDLVLVSKDKEYLQDLIPKLNAYLCDTLRLNFHPKKVDIHFYTKGVDFLGYVTFPHHILIRKRTKRRILRKFEEEVKGYQEGKISKEKVSASLQSYLGVFSHADAYTLSRNLKNYFWFTVN